MPPNLKPKKGHLRDFLLGLPPGPPLIAAARFSALPCGGLGAGWGHQVVCRCVFVLVGRGLYGWSTTPCHTPLWWV